jgi:hypothetical protein
MQKKKKSPVNKNSRMGNAFIKSKKPDLIFFLCICSYLPEQKNWKHLPSKCVKALPATMSSWDRSVPAMEDSDLNYNWVLACFHAFKQTRKCVTLWRTFNTPYQLSKCQCDAQNWGTWFCYCSPDSNHSRSGPGTTYYNLVPSGVMSWWCSDVFNPFKAPTLFALRHTFL